MEPKPGAKLILVVDDDDDVRSFYETALEEDGYRIQAFGDTASARGWLASGRPDLVLLDIMMPDGNGLDFCEWILSQKDLSRIPIIVNSGSTGDETLESALEIGAADILRKPVSVQTLKERVRKYLQRPA